MGLGSSGWRRVRSGRRWWCSPGASDLVQSARLRVLARLAGTWGTWAFWQSSSQSPKGVGQKMGCERLWLGWFRDSEFQRDAGALGYWGFGLRVLDQGSGGGGWIRGGAGWARGASWSWRLGQPWQRRYVVPWLISGCGMGWRLSAGVGGHFRFLRVGGSVSACSVTVTVTIGSPPRGRGRRGESGRFPGQRRFTPAWAGLPAYPDLNRAGFRIHPRVRGVAVCRACGKQGAGDSPPRTRGRLLYTPAVVGRSRFTPAHAGPP